MSSTQSLLSDAPRASIPASSDAVAWHRRLCFVGDRLLVSGDLSPDATVAAAQVVEWSAAEVCGVIDCRGEYSDASLIAELAPEIRYTHIGIDDDGGPRPDSWFDSGVDRALDTLARSEGRVLVHCHMGINRGPSMAFAILLALGWESIAALEAIRSARPIAALIYAEDAVDWLARRSGKSPNQVARARAKVTRWQEANEIDIYGVISRIRLGPSEDES
ncbi:MAG: dual specificity protein phosphatase [Actinomycetes bacterium]